MLLQAAGLSRSAPRKEWPLPMLKQVLAELIQETPHQLLARELWCGSGSAADWWSFQSGYTSSTAAMSMVTTLRFAKPQTSLHRLLRSSFMYAASAHGQHSAKNKPGQAAAFIFRVCSVCAWSLLYAPFQLRHCSFGYDVKLHAGGPSDGTWRSTSRQHSPEQADWQGGAHRLQHHL